MADPADVVTQPLPSAATDTGFFGLYPAGSFCLTDGTCGDCATIPSALWYFERETIAVPAASLPAAGYAPLIATFDDVRGWHAARADDAPFEYPPLVWVAAPQIIRHAQLHADGASLDVVGTTLAIERIAKIPLNRSFYDASSTRFFVSRLLTVRGALNASGRFVVRTLWPEDFHLRDLPPPRALPSDASPKLMLRQLMREESNGGARSPFAAFTLWQKHSAPTDWRGRTVLAFIVNGAQGDDDEAHAGHFAIVTGRIADDGAIGDWLVNNFYTLDAESEKGIIAAPVPLDNYLADLNSGQAYYRPSYLLVAVLRHESAATLVQAALGRVYNQFYRHQLVYYHPTTNCTSISIDTLRALGFGVPARGPTGRLLAWLGFPYFAVKERSVAKAKLAFDYLTVDQTRLMPAAAIEEIFGSLSSLAASATTNSSPHGALGRMLAQDLDGLVFLRIPQIPSSRAWGNAPAVNAREYRARVPRDRSKVQIVPVPLRPFPERLRDADLQPAPPHPSDRAALVWGAILVVGIPRLIAWTWKHLRASR
ncbi:MAG TPA: hypothetical protein VGL25_14860 [Casimicrobiaceae bacterium]|jgi:hypothetical protein